MKSILEILDYLESVGYEFQFIGDSSDSFEGFSSLRNYKENSLTWVRDKKVLEEIETCNIQFIVVQAGVEIKARNKIITEKSKEIFFAILKHFWGELERKPQISQDSYISKKVVIADSASIGHNCTIDGDIIIGENTIIEDNVVLMNKMEIGDNCIIHAGCVFGKDGFGFSFDEKGIPHKVEHFGGICIGDNVEIGGNVIVDRGTIDDTVIGDDTKIDSHCLIAHNSVIGSKVLIVGGVLVGGSCRIGDGTYIAPGVILKNQTSVGINSFVGMGVLMNNNVGDNEALLPGSKKTIKIRDYKRFL